MSSTSEQVLNVLNAGECSVYLLLKLDIASINPLFGQAVLLSVALVTGPALASPIISPAALIRTLQNIAGKLGGKRNVLAGKLKRQLDTYGGSSGGFGGSSGSYVEPAGFVQISAGSGGFSDGTNFGSTFSDFSGSSSGGSFGGSSSGFGSSSAGFGGSSGGGGFGGGGGCSTTYEQQCSTVNEQQCSTVNEQQCR